MDVAAIGTLITAVTAGASGVIVAFNSRGRKRKMYDTEDAEELADLREWRIDVLRLWAKEAARLVSLSQNLLDLPEYPPRDTRRRRRLHRQREEEEGYEGDL